MTISLQEWQIASRRRRTRCNRWRTCPATHSAARTTASDDAAETTRTRTAARRRARAVTDTKTGARTRTTTTPRTADDAKEKDRDAEDGDSSKKKGKDRQKERKDKDRARKRDDREDVDEFDPMNDSASQAAAGNRADEEDARRKRKGQRKQTVQLEGQRQREGEEEREERKSIVWLLRRQQLVEHTFSDCLRPFGCGLPCTNNNSILRRDRYGHLRWFCMRPPCDRSTCRQLECVLKCTDRVSDL